MNKFTQLSALLMLLILPAGQTGCASLKVEDVAPAIKTLAYTGTWWAVKENPEWRDKFVTAVNELRALESAERIDWTTLMAIVVRLPVDELASDEARLAITAGTMLLSSYGGRLIQLDKLDQVKPIATALREGIEQGLQSTAPPSGVPTRAMGSARRYYSPR